MSSKADENNTELLIKALLHTLNDQGWTLQAISSFSKTSCAICPAIEITDLLEQLSLFDVAILEFKQVTSGQSEKVRFDSQAAPQDSLYGWSEEGKFSFGALISNFVDDVATLMLQQVPDRDLNAEQLRVKYLADGFHPAHGKSDWQFEVANDITLRGYWEWVAAVVESVEL